MQDDNIFMSNELKDIVYEDINELNYDTESKAYLSIDDLELSCALHSFEKLKNKNILSFITSSNMFLYLFLNKKIDLVFDLFVKKPLVFNVDKNIHKIEKINDIYLVSIEIEDFNHGIWFF